MSRSQFYSHILVPKYLHSETLGIRRLSIYSSGLSNFNVPGMKYNEKDYFALYGKERSIAYFEHIPRSFCIPADDILIKHRSSAKHTWLRKMFLIRPLILKLFNETPKSPI